MRWSASRKRPARAFESSSNLRPLGEGRSATFEKSVMSMMMIALLVVLLPPPQTGATRMASTMQPDVDRLVRAAETLTGTWPSQPPPPVPDVAVVARHAGGPALRRSECRTRSQALEGAAAGCADPEPLYSESQHCGRTYCDGDPPARIGRVREGVAASHRIRHGDAGAFSQGAARSFQAGEGLVEAVRYRPTFAWLANRSSRAR
jgi:hypothetical protein